MIQKKSPAWLILIFVIFLSSYQTTTQSGKEAVSSGQSTTVQKASQDTSGPWQWLKSIDAWIRDNIW